MIPAWMYTLGTTIVAQSDIVIPFEDLFLGVLSVAAPITLGLVIRRWLPRLGVYLVRAQKPLSVICIIMVVAMGAYTKRYVFTLVQHDWRILVSLMLLCYCGLAIAGAIGFLTRQSPSDRLTIALETAIQNTAIAVIILQNTLPQPQSDLAIVMPVAQNFFLPVPLLCAAVVREVYLRWKKGKRGFAALFLPSRFLSKFPKETAVRKRSDSDSETDAGMCELAVMPSQAGGENGVVDQSGRRKTDIKSDSDDKRESAGYKKWKEGSDSGAIAKSEEDGHRNGGQSHIEGLDNGSECDRWDTSEKTDTRPNNDRCERAREEPVSAARLDSSYMLSSACAVAPGEPPYNVTSHKV